MNRERSYLCHPCFDVGLGPFYCCFFVRSSKVNESSCKEKNETPLFVFNLNDQVQSTIEVLASRVTAKEEEANKLKKLVNELCREVGLPERYHNVAMGESVGRHLRKD